MNKNQINNGRDECILGEKGINYFEKKHDATYVADLCLKNVDGDWVNQPAAIFYREKPTQPDYSQYFAIFARDGKTFITNGISAVSKPIIAVQADNGEIIFSRYRHDYRTSKDGSVFIDGGRDYSRSTFNAKMFKINIVDGKMVAENIIENLNSYPKNKF